MFSAKLTIAEAWEHNFVTLWRQDTGKKL